MVAATVTLLDIENKEVQKTITDSSGHFLITVLKNGSYALLVIDTGYFAFKVRTVFNGTRVKTQEEAFT